MEIPERSVLATHWRLDSEIVFLNHGSFGACPTMVLDVQTEPRRRAVRISAHLYNTIGEYRYLAVGLAASRRD